MLSLRIMYVSPVALISSDIDALGFARMRQISPWPRECAM